MLIRIKKKTDGSAALSCVRSDGTVTWQRQDGQQGRFTDFGQPWPRGGIPPEAHVVEQIVGFLDTERAAGGEWLAADLRLVPPYALGNEELRRVRDSRAQLFARWAALPPGETLELRFVHLPKPA